MFLNIDYENQNYRSVCFATTERYIYKIIVNLFSISKQTVLENWNSIFYVSNFYYNWKKILVQDVS